MDSREDPAAYTFEVTTLNGGKGLVVKFRDALDDETWSKLHDDLVTYLERDYRNVLFDMSEMDFCNSTAIGMWVSINAMVRNRGGSLQLRLAPGSALEQLILVTQLNRILDIEKVSGF